MEKTLLVQVVSSMGEAFNKQPFEVSFSTTENGSIPEITLLYGSLVKKSTELGKKLADSSSYSFQRASIVSPSSMVEIGEDSPLKNLSTVSCVYVPKFNHELIGGKGNIHWLFLLFNVKRLCIYHMIYYTETEAEPMVAEEVEQQVQAGTSQQAGIRNTRTVLQKTEGRLPTGYKIPTRFHTSIDTLMKNNKAVFTMKQINQAVRDVKDHMWVHVYSQLQPTTAELSHAIHLLVTDYPLLYEVKLINRLAS